MNINFRLMKLIFEATHDFLTLAGKQETNSYPLQQI